MGTYRNECVRADRLNQKEDRAQYRESECFQLAVTFKT
jgi:hypothetical protein